METILVTGGAGLIGRSIIKNLLNRGKYKVVANDLVSTPLLVEIKSKDLVFVQGDLRDYQFVDGLISKVDAVIHLAAPSSFLMYKEKPRESTFNTIQSFLNILEAMKKHGKKKVIHASTSAVYEGHTVPYKENMIINPPDLKALSKKMNEEMGNLYSISNNIASIAMRPFSVYGEGEDVKGGYANVTSLFAWAIVAGKRPVIWGDGNQKRDLIHADDVAEIFALALEKDIKSQPLNVGTGIETSFNRMVEIINGYLGTNLKPIYVPVPIDIYAQRLLSDNSVIEKVLGFKPRVSAKEGIKRVVDYAKKVLLKEPSLAEKQLYFETLPKEK